MNHELNCDKRHINMMLIIIRKSNKKERDLHSQIIFKNQHKSQSVEAQTPYEFPQAYLKDIGGE